MVVFEDVFAIVLQPACERANAPTAPAAVNLMNSLLDCLFFMGSYIYKRVINYFK
jgi:hypothetical protein